MNAVDADEEAMYTSEKLVRRENVQRSRGLRVGDLEQCQWLAFMITLRGFLCLPSECGESNLGCPQCYHRSCGGWQ